MHTLELTDDQVSLLKIAIVFQMSVWNESFSRVDDKMKEKIIVGLQDIDEIFQTLEQFKLN